MKKADVSHKCQLCGSGTKAELRPAVILRPAVGELIRRDYGTWDEHGWICSNDLERYRHKYVEELLEAEKGELTEIEREVLDSLKEQDILLKNPTI